MRNLVWLGLFALMTSIPSNSAFAGSIGDCDFLKDKSLEDYVPGLYGICVAWHNASANGNENALAALEAKWFRTGGEGPIPGSEPDATPDGDPQWFECPCIAQLDRDYVCNLGTPIADTLEPFAPEDPNFFGVYQGFIVFLQDGSVMENFGMPEDLSECSHTINGLLISLHELNFVNGAICGYELGILAGKTESGLCSP